MNTTKFSALLTFLALFALSTPASANTVLDCAALGGTNCQGTIPDSPIQTTFTPFVSVFTAPAATCVGQARGIGIRVNLVHDHVGDLTVAVTGPGGNSVLFDQPLGTTGTCAGDDISAIFANGGLTANTCTEAGIPATSGTFLPVSGAAALNLASPAGAWTLTVTDNSNGFEGFVQDWAVIALCDARPEIVPTQPTAALFGLLLVLAFGGFLGVARNRRKPQ